MHGVSNMAWCGIAWYDTGWRDIACSSSVRPGASHDTARSTMAQHVV